MLVQFAERVVIFIVVLIGSQFILGQSSHLGKYQILTLFISIPFNFLQIAPHLNGLNLLQLIRSRIRVVIWVFWYQIRISWIYYFPFSYWVFGRSIDVMILSDSTFTRSILHEMIKVVMIGCISLMILYISVLFSKIFIVIH